MKKLFFAAALAVGSNFTPINAQLLSVNTNSTTIDIPKSSTEEIKEWSIFTDKENKMVYIDFEKINVNLSSVIVKDTDSKVLFKDENLWQLPVNTIYEVDLSKYAKGSYVVELKTFTSVVKKNVVIN